MAEIIIDPVTRISGFLEIMVEIEQNRISNAQSRGLLFRGFETMLKGRQPLDAIYFTERICGICSAAHSYASALALENALQIEPGLNDKYLRDIIHGFEYIQNHLRHFYVMLMPSFVRISSPAVASVTQDTDYRLPDNINRQLEEHYARGYQYSMLAHEGQAVLAGKAPHNHGIFAGGVNTDITAYKLEKIRATVNTLKAFVDTEMREDAEQLAYYYPDYYHLGISYPYFMSYGAFNYADKDISYVSPGILADGYLYAFWPQVINQQIQYTWFVNDTTDEVNLKKADAYTFIKAPRYNNMPMEVGPLARMLISGNYTGGHSCMDRIMARMLETGKILSIMGNLIDRVELLPNGQRELIMPELSQGAGLTDTTRGSLAHFVSIKDKVIDHYSIITPSNWNLSPRDANGTLGVLEKSLMGTAIRDGQNPVEIGRIVRSFDPCVSCATHLITPSGDKKVIEVMV
jgi:hydrogenase large subunit